MHKGPWIEITTILPCVNNCSYCPQNILKEKYEGNKILTLASFNRILDNIPLNIPIYFSGFGEPFQNKECVEMILEANRRGYKIGLWTTLAGLSEQGAEKIKDVPFIFVHVHDIGQKKRNYEWIDEWKKAVVNSRGGNLFDTGGKKANGCARSDKFDTNVMLPNGDVYLCCSDWGLQHKLGNLFDDNFNNLARLEKYELCDRCAYAL